MAAQIDCIPPHIDHHDFSRPFCTISLLSEQSIMFGHKLVPLSAGNFVGATCEPFYLPLPTGAHPTAFFEGLRSDGVPPPGWARPASG